MKNPQVSRRNLIKSASAGVIGLAVGNLANVSLSQNTADSQLIKGIYRKTLGDFKLTFINDAAFDLPVNLFAINASEADVEAVLKSNNLPTETHTTALSNLLVQTANRTILFDTGLGDVESFGPDVGRLLPTLATIGVSANDITDVIISHFHPDHVGAISFNGKLNFPNAQFYFPQTEWDFLNGPATGDEQADSLIALAKTKLEPVVSADQVIFYKDEDELITGVQALATPGHTPGHHSFLLNSANETLLLTVDALNHPILTMQNPEWIFGFDAIPDQTVASRRQLFGRAADEKLQIFSNHFPFPGVGYVVRDGTGFRFISVG